MLPPPRLVSPPEDDERLVVALRGGRAWAERMVLERFTPHVRRVLVRILGSTAELDDLTQEVFLRGLERITKLRDDVELRLWFGSFAVNVARETLRARARRRWLLFLAPEDVPEPRDDASLSDATTDAGMDARRALRATYDVLGSMRIELRMAFVLRHLESMELGEVARLRSLACHDQTPHWLGGRSILWAGPSEPGVAPLDGGEQAMNEDRLRDLTEAIVPAQDRAMAKVAVRPVAESVAALEATRRERQSQARARRRAGRVGVVGLGAACALAGVVLWVTGPRQRPLAFEVGFAGEAGIVGAPLAAPTTESLPLRFSDGTELVLAETTIARVVSVAPEGARVMVERGEIRAAVVPRANGAWLVAVGPFEVHVKGTRFDAAWDAKRETFTLHMYEGAVILTSRCLPAARGAAAGDALELSCKPAPSSPPSAEDASARRAAASAEPVLPAGGAPTGAVGADALLAGRGGPRPSETGGLR